MKRLYLSVAQATLLAALFASPAYGQVFERPEPCQEIILHNSNGEFSPQGICNKKGESWSEIIVTASRLEHLKKQDLTSPVSTLKASEIQARGNANVADLLRTIPGASINRSGPAGALTQLRLRGSEGNHVLVLVDGVEVSNPNTGEFDFGSLRSEDVVRIEVLRGEQSALWGSDAIGGVVNIITRAGETSESYRVSVEAGSFNTLEGQVSAVVPIKGAALSINGNVFRTDGYDVSGLDGEDGGEDDGANSRALNVGLNNVDVGRVTLSAKYSASHAVSEFDSDTDFDGRLNDTNSELTTDSKTGRVSARFELAGFDNLINLGLTDTRQNTTGTSFRNDTTGKRTQLNWAAEKSWDVHSLTILAETEREEFSNFGGDGAGQNQNESTQNHALAADYRYNKNAITLSVSARADFNDRFDDSQTWRVGAGYAFESIGGRVRASVGTGVKNPSMTELFGFFPAFFVGNPDIRPETSTGYNIGYDQEFGGWNFSVDYFRSDLENEIFTDFGVFPATVFNRTTQSTREGVELEGRGSIGDNLDIRASATFLDAEENGIRELRRPKFLASATATWTPVEPLSVTLSADHNGSQIDTDFATFSRVELEAFTLVGLNIRYSVSDIVTLSVRAENLLDEDYEEVVGFASQGRGVYAGINANF
ncbi:MAG: TonB-dependent receptor [Robiginitomaculum sp.]|nr:TonB-dependent receptor [Robiginitomaculum sp.]